MAQPGLPQSFLVADYDSALKNALRTHRPDGAKMDLKPVLDVIDKTPSRANNSINDALILQCKCSGGDAHGSTLVILKMLEKYAWDAKAVITIAAFAMNYGKFSLFAQPYLAHSLAKYVAILKHLPDAAEHGSTHQHLFGSIKGLIGAIVELAKVMDQFDDLNHKYISEDKPPLSNAMTMIHEPAYWGIFSVVCTEQIASLAGVSIEKTTSYPVANLTMRVNQVLKIMQKHLDTCFSFIGENQSKGLFN